jgi:hypothetical protein
MSSSASSLVHPFAHSRDLLVLIPNKIDVEEESRLYDELCDSHMDRRVYRRSRSPQAPPSVFSKEIWLGDNSGLGLAFARDVTISGWTNVGDKLRGAYVVYNCVIKTKEGTTMHAHKRYSSFAQLDSSLQRNLPRQEVNFLPPLPPKTPFARYRPSFLDHRRCLLQYWLSAILLHPEIGGSRPVRQWIMD